jgi:hypothetical protein
LDRDTSISTNLRALKNIPFDDLDIRRAVRIQTICRERTRVQSSATLEQIGKIVEDSKNTFSSKKRKYKIRRKNISIQVRVSEIIQNSASKVVHHFFFA